MVVFVDFSKNDMHLLLEDGFAIIEPATYYEQMRMKGRCTAVLFRSGKLLLQGSDAAVKSTVIYLRGHGFTEQKKQEFKCETGIIIGSDETLKGDTFGGLVVAGVRADTVERENLRLMGVMDSKKMTDDIILKIAPEIQKIVHHSIIRVLPERYNTMKQTALLNQLHTQVYQELRVPGAKHIVDKYPGCSVGQAETKAESKYLEVAAASIIAREAGLQHMAELSKKLGMKVPLGSTHVKEALLFLKKSKKEPTKFVKIHFKNVQAIFNTK